MFAKKIKIVMILAICMTVLGLTSSASAEIDWNYVLKVGWGSEPRTLDLAQQGDKVSVSASAFHIHETLVWLDPVDFSVKPLLAERWEVLNPQTYRFYIRKGVKFHDGTPLNAEAVKYSLDRVLDPKTAAPRRFYIDMIDNIKVLDEYTVEIHTKTPLGPFLQHLAYQTNIIISPTAAKKYGLEGYSTHPAGTGPYKFKSWKKGQELVLERNEDYWRGRPKLKGIIIKKILETSTRMVALETGEIDVAVDVPAHEVKRLSAVPGVVITPIETPRNIYIALNNDYKPFDDVRIRRAINYAYDRKTLIKTLFEGKFASESTGYMAPFIFGYKEIPYEYNVQKAKKLMAEAGYPNGFTCELYTPVGRYPMDKQAATMFAFQMKKNLNIQVNVKVMEWGGMNKALKTRKFPLALMGWGNVTGDADSGLTPLFDSRERKATKNLANYVNPELDKILEKARQITDQDERLRLYAKAQDILARDRPWCNLYRPKLIFGLRDYVKGFNPRMELWLVDTCWVEK